LCQYKILNKREFDFPRLKALNLVPTSPGRRWEDGCILKGREPEENFKSSADVEEIFRQYRMSPFAEWIGIKIDRLAESYCRLTLLLGDKCKNYTDGIHGGVLATLADTCMGGAVRSLGLQAVTAELTINYLGKPGVDDELTAEGRVVHRGSTLILTECMIRDGNHKKICSGRGIFVSRGFNRGSKE
jgi:acyl-CoA thioesterase